MRIGTSGAIQPDIPVDSFILSEHAIGLDGILHFYDKAIVENVAMTKRLSEHLSWSELGIMPYCLNCDEKLKKVMASNHIRLGITVTNSGFYGPQGRQLRLAPKLQDFHEKLASFQFQNTSITNLEMETAAIYGLSKLLGHRAISLNAILANRPLGTFSNKPKQTVDSLIGLGLELLTSNK